MLLPVGLVLNKDPEECVERLCTLNDSKTDVTPKHLIVHVVIMQNDHKHLAGDLCW